MTHRCCRCEVERPPTEFHKNKNRKNGLNSQCKICYRETSSTYRKNNREKLRLQSQEYRLNNSGKIQTAATDLRRKFSILNTSAKRRGYEVSLTFFEYSIILKNLICFYCDIDISKQQGSCLNRVDNTKGYTRENVRPCCYICNTIMMDFTRDELKARLKKIDERI